jgi:NAD-dependent dihydropyrimidine dehydrogenase PreA subunit
MAYVITDSCIKDALCIDACPTDCIHPRKDEAQFEGATQMYVDPENCIDCGACVSACTSTSIYLKEELPAGLEHFAESNAAYFTNA